MITAQEAYDLAKPNYDKYLEFINEKIKTAAKNGKTSIIIRENPYSCWLYGPDKNDQEVDDLLKLLKERGFSISLYYNEGQFVDIGLNISWDKK